jgi:hypothetical protein
MVREW